MKLMKTKNRPTKKNNKIANVNAAFTVSSTNLTSRRFHELALKKAAVTITPTELKELNALDKMRRKTESKDPIFKKILKLQKERDRLLEQLSKLLHGKTY